MTDNSDKTPNGERRYIDERTDHMIPAMNEVLAQVGTEAAQYPEEAEEKRYMILYPDDYQGHGIDVEGNVALLLDRENAEEVKRLAEDIIERIENDD